MKKIFSISRVGLRHLAALAAFCVLALGMDRADFVVSCLAVAALFVCDWLRCKKGPLTPQLLAKPVALQWAVLLAGILLVVVFGMYGEGYVEKPFIYFQF